MAKIIAIAFIIIGVGMVAFTGFNYFTTEKVLDAGPLHITKEKEHTIQWPPVAGGVLILAGLVIIFTNGNKKV